MLQPVLHLMTTRPELLADHALAYSELVVQEVGLLARAWRRRTLLMAVAL